MDNRAYNAAFLEIALPKGLIAHNSLSAFSKHGRARAQGRAVPLWIIGILEQNGDIQRSHGCDLLYFSKASKARIARDWGDDYRLIERWMNVYAVVADNGLVVTVGHRTKRIRRL